MACSWKEPVKFRLRHVNHFTHHMASYISLFEKLYQVLHILQCHLDARDYELSV